VQAAEDASNTSDPERVNVNKFSPDERRIAIGVPAEAL
jgi:hypothetical protein